MNRRASLLLAAVSIGLVACTAGAPAASPTPVPFPSPSAQPTDPPRATPPPNTMPAGLAGRSFVSVRVTDGDDDFPLVPGTRIDLSFIDGLGARAGCNHLFGRYRIDGDRLLVDQMGMTEMGCEPPLMAQDQWLIAFLSSGPTFALNGNDLLLTSGDVTITLLDREIAEPDQPLQNITWGLTSLITGDAVSSVPLGVMPTLLFRDDGTLELNTGCNSGGGSYTVEGDRLVLRDIVLTDMACAGAAGQVEQAVVSVLGVEGLSLAIDGTSLTLMAGNNGLQYSAAVDT
jgi:heat shock protein HslJ